MRDDDLEIIDPPVGPHSPESEIREWLEQLRQRKQTKTVKLCIEQAEAWLTIRRPAIDTFYGPEKETKDLEGILRRRDSNDNSD